MSFKIYAPLIFLLALIILLIVVIYNFAIRNYKESTDTSVISGRVVRQSVYGSDAQNMFSKVKDNFLKIEDKLSCDADSSDIDKINSGSGIKWIKVEKDTIDILDRVFDVSKNSKGVFDVTCLPLFRLWGFEDNQVNEPSDEEIDSILSHVDYNIVSVNHNLERVKLSDELSKISLSSLFDGILCESAINVYKNYNAKYGVISVGNVTGLYGEKKEQPCWKLSLKDPFSDDISIGNIKVRDGYVSTFGSEFDKIPFNGEKINKIINPVTGRLPNNDILSATVLYADPVIASVLAQICCTVDKKESFKILSYYGAEAIFIDAFKNIYVMENIYDQFSLIKDDYNVYSFSV